jgi:hypothetical protein
MSDGPFEKIRIGPFDFTVRWYRRVGEERYNGLGYCYPDQHAIGVAIDQPIQGQAETLYGQILNALVDTYDIDLLYITSQEELKRAGAQVENDMQRAIREISLGMVSCMRDNPEVTYWILNSFSEAA